MPELEVVKIRRGERCPIYFRRHYNSHGLREQRTKEIFLWSLRPSLLLWPQWVGYYDCFGARRVELYHKTLGLCYCKMYHYDDLTSSFSQMSQFLTWRTILGLCWKGLSQQGTTLYLGHLKSYQRRQTWNLCKIDFWIQHFEPSVQSDWFN